MSFGQAVSTCMKKYADFTGRAQRSEFWWFFLFTFLLGLVASIIDLVLKTPAVAGFGVVGLVVGLAVLVPSAAALVRRLHDSSKTGWLALVTLIPCAGVIAFIVFGVLESTPGDNQYGPTPEGMGGPGGQQFGGPSFGGPAAPYQG